MAKIVENPHGGRRMIRLSEHDVAMVISAIQQRFGPQATSHQELKLNLQQQPLYLPEDVL
mgnify:CR=1 FL=1